LFNFPQQLIHTFTFLFNAVPHEMNLRRARKVEGEAQLFPNVGSRVTESAEGQPVFLFVSGNSYENLGVPAIVGKANIGDRNHRQSRVFQFVPDNLGNLFANNVCDSLWATHDKKQEQVAAAVGRK
jgi:hypothetical protein